MVERIERRPHIVGIAFTCKYKVKHSRYDGPAAGRMPQPSSGKKQSVRHDPQQQNRDAVADSGDDHAPPVHEAVIANLRYARGAQRQHVRHAIV